MNTIKSLGLVGLAATALIATQAFATTCPINNVGQQTMGSPTCIAPYGQDGAGTGLQDELNAITTSGPDINVYTGQYQPSSFWSIGASGGSENKILLEIAGNANKNTFGIFDPTNPNNYLQLFSGPASAGWSTLLSQTGNTYTATYFNGSDVYQGQSSITINGNLFGYYLSGPGGTFYSDPSMNETGGTVYPNGMPHMVTYAGTGQTYLNGKKFLSGEYLLAWEDSAWGKSDLDYQDFVVLVESVHSVPEPAVLGMFGLGVLLIGGLAALRRRQVA
ncbi:MAG: PEP-CTERM sorting domain-containing protein [Xanthomonadaceae bacterium]|nr:PEP-CTERM sorting domain-containing protein [Xanthomonadaceae bacterium]